MSRAFNLGEELKKAGVPAVDTGREQIEYIPIEKIDPDERNFYNIGDVSELAESIEMVGLQQPLRVRGGERGHVTVVSGHRRRAAILLLRDSGSTLFDKGVPCIRERGDVSSEWQELRLIYGNSATRVLSGAEISLQSEKVVEILTKLEAQGVKLPGRTRDHVAAILQTSKSRIGRLHAIRANLVPELLEEFDGRRLGETLAYRLSQEEATVQHDLAARLGPAVRGLTSDSVEKVLSQIKQPLVAKPEETAKPAASESAVGDSLKRCLEEREKEDREFWQLMQDAADSLIHHSFAAGATATRKENIDMLRIDCRNAGVGGFAGDWQGSNKGLAIGSGQRITRTWTEVYDALAAIAITRYRAIFPKLSKLEHDNERLRARIEKDRAVPTVGTALRWQTGDPPEAAVGWYAVRVQPGSMELTMRRYLWWNGGRFTRGPESAVGVVSSTDTLLGWFRLPDEEV